MPQSFDMETHRSSYESLTLQSTRTSKDLGKKSIGPLGVNIEVKGNYIKTAVTYPIYPYSFPYYLYVALQIYEIILPLLQMCPLTYIPIGESTWKIQWFIQSSSVHPSIHSIFKE